MTPEELELDELEPEDIRPLRTRVLRPHFPDDKLEIYDEDDDPQTAHYGLVDGAGRVHACVTYIRIPAPGDIGGPATRLRGMAVRDGARGGGLGSRLLQGSLTRLAVAQPDLEIVWCNARTSARDFYEGHGFETHGEVFEVDKIGPHIVMWREMPESLA